MRRKPINTDTMKLVAEALLRRFADQRHGGLETTHGHQMTLPQICAAVAQCGISPEALANACAVEWGGFEHSRGMYDELDRELAASLGEGFAVAFVERLSITENLFREHGLPVY